jgi:hypothetical protein
MYVSKDIYEYLTNFVDENTVCNMLSVNKKFISEEYYRRVIERKYPFLLTFKDKDIDFKYEEKLNYRLSWRNFYIRNIYYILKITGL